jgi:hypothetical protein
MMVKTLGHDQENNGPLKYTTNKWPIKHTKGITSNIKMLLKICIKEATNKTHKM